MKIKNILHFLLIGVIILSSCVKEPVVLDFDDSYTPKAPVKGKRDAIPPVDLLNVYAYFLNNEVSQTVNRTINADGTLTIDAMDDRAIELRTSIPVESNMMIELSKMTAENGGENYPKIIKGLTVELPSEAYSLSKNEITLAKGEKNASVNIQFHKDKFLALDKAKTYALPLVMKLKEGKAIIVNYYVLYISLQDVELLPQGDNVTAVNAVPAGTLYQTKAITITSNYAQEHLYKLNDGDMNYANNWWTQSGGNTWLAIGLKNSTKIKAVVLKTHYWDRKTIKSAKIWASQDGGTTYVEQGDVSFTDETKTAIVSFKTPININSVKITNFIGYESWIDIHEIQMIGE